MNARLAPCALVLLNLTGCVAHAYRPVPITPEAWAAASHRQVRITLADGSRIHLVRPELAGDTVRGVRDRGENRAPRLAAIATRDVVRLETRQVNWFATIGLTTLCAAGATGAVLIVTGQGYMGGWGLGSGDWGGWP